MIIKALSIRAPWCWAILHAGKDHENRPKPWRSYRGPLLLHASKTCNRFDYDLASDVIEGLSGKRPPPFELAERGGIVGAVLLTGCADPLRREQRWRFPGEYGLKLEHPIALPFRPMRGQLAPFDVTLTREEERLLTPMLEAWKARAA